MIGGQVIVVTGPPGAGKTTVARLVAGSLSPSVHLHADDFWDSICSGRIEPWLPESQHQNEIVIAVLAEAAFGYARGGYHVIVDGIVGPWFIHAFRDRGEAADLPLHYMVLRPAEAVAVQRAIGRGSDALTDDGPVHKMYAEFSGLADFEANVIDNGGQEPAQTARLVAEHVATGSHRLAPRTTS